jgi:uncharacterized protein (DUF2236 family)
MPTPILPAAADWPSLAPHPGTITWRRAGDARVLIAAGYALLLQVAHPTVGAGVSEHSQFQLDPWGRLLRTLDYACTIVYGGPEAAGEMGRRIRSFHAQIKGTRSDGTRYHALEPGAYAWVHATLAEGIFAAHARFGRSFTDGQRQELWSEWRALGRLLGIRDGDLPPDWLGFRLYVEEMIESELERTAAVEDVWRALASPAAPPASTLGRGAWPILSPALAHLLRISTAGLAPATLRRRRGLGWTRADELELRVLGATLRAATPLMPPSLRNTGPGYLRWRHEAIERGEVASPGRFDRSGARRGSPIERLGGM